MQPKILCFLILGDPPTHLLLGRKKTGFGAGKVVGIGGGIEPGETPEAAAIRELAEETCVGVRPADLHPAGTVDFVFPARPSWSQFVHLYTATIWQGAPTESDEIVPTWAALDAIPYDQMWPDASHWLPRLLAGEPIHLRFTYAADCRTIAVVESV